jgi:hypothetical protein
VSVAGAVAGAAWRAAANARSSSNTAYCRFAEVLVSVPVLCVHNIASCVCFCA